MITESQITILLMGWNNWDSGQIDFIFITREQTLAMGWRRITSRRREKLERMLHDDVKIYNMYLHNVYGIIRSREMEKQ